MHVQINISFSKGALKGTVASDDFFDQSNPTGLVINDLKLFWPGSSKYRIMTRIASFSLIGEFTRSC